MDAVQTCVCASHVSLEWGCTAALSPHSPHARIEHRDARAGCYGFLRVICTTRGQLRRRASFLSSPPAVVADIGIGTRILALWREPHKPWTTAAASSSPRPVPGRTPLAQIPDGKGNIAHVWQRYRPAVHCSGVAHSRGSIPTTRPPESVTRQSGMSYILGHDAHWLQSPNRTRCLSFVTPSPQLLFASSSAPAADHAAAPWSIVA